VQEAGSSSARAVQRLRPLDRRFDIFALALSHCLSVVHVRVIIRGQSSMPLA